MINQITIYSGSIATMEDTINNYTISCSTSIIMERTTCTIINNNIVADNVEQYGFAIIFFVLSVFFWALPYFVGFYLSKNLILWEK